MRLERKEQQPTGKERIDEHAAGRERTWLPLLFLLVIPAALFLSTLIIPFLPLSGQARVWIISGLLISTEIVFWGAALYFGKEIASRYRRFFNPRNWFGK